MSEDVDLASILADDEVPDSMDLQVTVGEVRKLAREVAEQTMGMELDRQGDEKHKEIVGFMARLAKATEKIAEKP